MGNARRQVERIARFEQPLLLVSEMGQHLERQPRDRRRIEAPRDAPAPPALRLQQEHVVLVDVRANAATIGGEADHHVVEARGRQEAKPRRQVGHGRRMQVDALDEQGPAGTLARRQRARAEGAVAQLEAPAACAHQARLDLRIGREPEQVLHRDRTAKARQRLADAQRALLPVARDEVGHRQRSQAAQRRAGRAHSSAPGGTSASARSS